MGVVPPAPGAGGSDVGTGSGGSTPAPNQGVPPVVVNVPIPTVAPPATVGGAIGVLPPVVSAPGGGGDVGGDVGGGGGGVIGPPAEDCPEEEIERQKAEREKKIKEEIEKRKAEEKEREKNEKVGICHETGSETNPFVFISVSINAVKAHTGHGDDQIGVSEEDCLNPAQGGDDDNGNGNGGGNAKVGICHETSSDTNPIVFIEVSENAVPAHERHGDEHIGVTEEFCTNLEAQILQGNNQGQGDDTGGSNGGGNGSGSQSDDDVLDDVGTGGDSLDDSNTSGNDNGNGNGNGNGNNGNGNGNNGNGNENGNGNGNNGNGNDKVEICHRTSSETNPFVLIEISENALKAHLDNHDDVFPENGACPTTAGDSTSSNVGGGDDDDDEKQFNGKVSICHVTGSDTNPFNFITVSANALKAHLGHGDTLAEDGVCEGEVIEPPLAVDTCPDEETAGSGSSGIDDLASEIDDIASGNSNDNVASGDNSASGGASADDDGDFVQNLYKKRLRRLGAQHEIDFWTKVMNEGGGRTAVVEGIETSLEARSSVVKNWYAQFLGRAAVNGEEGFWVKKLMDGETEEEVLSKIMGSAEFVERCPELIGADEASDETFVRSLYKVLLGRGATDAEVDGWVNLKAVLGNDGIAKGFLTSMEFRSKAVFTFYDRLLDRDADQAGMNFWVSASMDLAKVRRGFESSDEFFKCTC